MPFRVGGCAVFSFHGVTDAPRMHAQFKEAHLDAAVVDHAFLLSPLQLAVAWQRAVQDALFDHHHEHHRHAREPVARGLFLGLSALNHLHRALQVLTAGPNTTAVAVLVRDSDLTCDRRDLIRRVAQSCGAIAHDMDAVVPGYVLLSSSEASSSPLGGAEEIAVHAVRGFVEPQRLADYYQLTDDDIRAARRSFSLADEARLRKQCAQSGLNVAQNGPIWEDVLHLKALEICVVQKLALCGC